MITAQSISLRPNIYVPPISIIGDIIELERKPCKTESARNKQEENS